jgi:hypothetical protein
VTDQPTRVGDAPPDESGQTATAGTREPFWRRRWTVVIGAIVAGACLLYLAAYLVAGRDLPTDATVLGVGIGDLTRAEAEAKLASELPPIVEAPIAARVADDEQTFSLAPEESGLAIDYEATVDAVPGVSANPLSLAKALFGVGEIDPVPTVDRSELEAAISAIAEQANTEPVNGSVCLQEGHRRDEPGSSRPVPRCRRRR